MDKPTLISGSKFIDDRGHISFINDFTFNDIKRFYTVTNYSTEVIRAFHGHEKEDKYIFVSSGNVLVLAFDMSIGYRAAKNTYRFVLSDSNPSILFIPKGYAHGYRMLTENSIITFFSTSTLEESKNDDIRLPFDYLGRDVWKSINK